MDLGLDGPITVGERQASHDGILVLAQAVGKTMQFREVARFDGREPRLKFLTTAQAQHRHELLGQRRGLARGLAALADQFQFGLFLGSQLLGITDEQPARRVGGEAFCRGWWSKCDLLRVISQGLHEALDDPNFARKPLRPNLLIEVFGFMNALLPALEHIRRIGIEHAATSDLALPGRRPPLFEPGAHRPLGHAHPFGNRGLGQPL